MGKDCGNHGDRGRCLRRLFAGIVILIFLSLLAVFLVWAVLRPSKPDFTLQDATVSFFNTSATQPNYVTSSIGLTLLSHNPNDRIGIYYDKLEVYGLYRDQQITLRTSIQPFYQGHDENNIWSPIISGDGIPIAPYNSVALVEDQSIGLVQLTIKLNGRIRWKVGNLITGGYHLHATCPAILSFGSRSTGIVVDKGIKYQITQRCSVSA